MNHDETVPQQLPGPDATQDYAPPGETTPQSHESAQASAEKSQAVPGYQLLDQVGRGGMGEVYRARDLKLNRDVAVKLLQDRYSADGPTARRFLEEAQITGQLQHPGIPAVHQVGTLANGRPFLAMKLIKGRSLQEMLDAKEPINVLAVFEQIAQAIGYAHAHGVIHRDLKPANVMVGAFGEVQVMDWGLAKVISRDSEALRRVALDIEPFETHIHVERDSDHHSQSGEAMGTAAFMSPEQAIGAHDQLGPPSDVFGLGAVLCTLLTGKPPYQGESWESTRQLAAQAKQGDALARLDACGAEPELIELCKQCLTAEAKDRPAVGSAVAVAVAQLRTAANERAKQAEVRAAEQRTRRRVQLNFGTAVVATLLIGSAVAGWQAWMANRSAQAEHEAKQQAEVKTAEALSEKKRADDKSTEAFREKTRAEIVVKEQRQLLDVMRIREAGTLIDSKNYGLARDRLKEVSPGWVSPGNRTSAWWLVRGQSIGSEAFWTGHTGSVNCTAWSPDGQTLATGGGDKTVRFWNASSGQCVRELAGHEESVTCMSWSPDGRTLATGSGDKTVQLWDVATGKSRKLTGHTADVTCLA